METFSSYSEEETRTIAALFAKKLKKGDCLALCGELGAGKTIFVKGLYKGLGGSDRVLITSPTFTLMQIYPLPQGFLYHLDLYRLDKPQDLKALNLDDFLQGEEGISVVEWGNKIPQLTPYFTHRVDIFVEGEQERRIEITSFEPKPVASEGVRGRGD